MSDKKDYIISRIYSTYGVHNIEADNIIHKILINIDKYKGYHYEECLYDYFIKNNDISVENIEEVCLLLSKVIDEKIRQYKYKKAQVEKRKKQQSFSLQEKRWSKEIIDILKTNGLDKISIMPIMLTIHYGNKYVEVLRYLKERTAITEEEILEYLMTIVDLKLISDK